MGDFGLMFYNARWYDPALGRFAQADSVVPGGVQGYDRYAYANNSPVVYSDPSGHCPILCWIGAGLAIAGTIAVIEAVDVLTTPAAPGTRAAGPTGKDVTGWLVDRMNENATAPVTRAMQENLASSNPGQKIGALKGWTSLVTGGGLWDYKQDIRRAPALMQGGPNVILGGHRLNYQAAANINYGYMASRLGLPQGMAEFGAGVKQIATGQKGSLWSWGDDPFDNYMVRFGYALDRETQAQAGSLTQDDFTRSLNSYMERYGEPPNPLEPG